MIDVIDVIDVDEASIDLGFLKEVVSRDSKVAGVFHGSGLNAKSELVAWRGGLSLKVA